MTSKVVVQMNTRILHTAFRDKLEGHTKHPAFSSTLLLEETKLSTLLARPWTTSEAPKRPVRLPCAAMLSALTHMGPFLEDQSDLSQKEMITD